MTRFDWRGFIRVARELGGRGGDEAAQRSAISRAYDGVYDLAVLRLLDLGWPTPSGSQHHRVWTTYRTSSNEQCRRIANLGFHLRDRRVRADDATICPGTFNLPRETATALDLADEAVQLLDQSAPDERCFS